MVRARFEICNFSDIKLEKSERGEIKTEMNALKGKIKAKDLENLAAVKHENLERFVAYDKDYEEAAVKEYMTPKEFVKLFKIKSYKMEY